MSITHNLGFPRIGADRELKKAVEAYWSGKISAEELLRAGKEIRQKHLAIQAAEGLAFVPVGDFAWYDHILEWTSLLGVVPARFGQAADEPVSLDTVFRMGRGRAPTGEPAAACEMTKWFDTNYHYMVPELEADQTFRVAREYLFEHVEEAKLLGLVPKPVIPGPLTFLWLSKGDAFPAGAGDTGKLRLLEGLLPVYEEVFRRLAAQGVVYVQVDEGALVLDLPEAWRAAYSSVYARFAASPVKLVLTTYFGGLGDNADLALSLPVAGIHVDLVRDPSQLATVVAGLRSDQVLSAGIVSGRNIWRTDLTAVVDALRPVYAQLGDRLWIAPSCSLLHVPHDLDNETQLDKEILSWLSFAKQKLQELGLVSAALTGSLTGPKLEAFNAQASALANRRTSTRIHNPAVRAALAESVSLSRDRAPFATRKGMQKAILKLPPFATTTIGSFPQTAEIRSLRMKAKKGAISEGEYDAAMQEEIRRVVAFQEQIGLDVLVHGEPERNDMVEYFGELLDGFVFSSNGWVQSYGSRGVKPPIIFGDIDRPTAMTVRWSKFAQEQTQRPMKAMLTGPVTILQWSFVRDDQSRETTCRQLALALRKEVLELEANGIRVIQIDEPAVREGLPLRDADKSAFLDWAVDSFRLSTAGIKDDTQIHTHMCYAEFNEIISAIAAMDADVITIETSRSNMELLKAFETFRYPNDIGPGVYDIHSPNVPEVEEMVRLMESAASRIPVEQLWVNPDCGLKTRGWPEVEAALTKMVAAAQILRAKYPVL